MAWWMAIPAVISTVSSIMGAQEGQEAAEEAGEYSAAAVRSETAEAVRRANLQQEATLGTATAAIGGSGVQMAGTPQNYMDFLSSEMTAQTDWMARSGELRAQAAERGASQASSQIGWATAGNLANTWSSAFQGSWWGSQSPSSEGMT